MWPGQRFYSDCLVDDHLSRLGHYACAGIHFDGRGIDGNLQSKTEGSLMPDDILYSIRKLTVEYKARAGAVRAVDDVSSTSDVARSWVWWADRVAENPLLGKP